MEKRDIHNSKEGLSAAKTLLERSSFSDTQRKDLLRFLDLMAMGKAGAKKVGNHRLISYVYGWLKLYKYFKKDLNLITEPEIEKFYRDLDTDRIKQLNGKHYKPNSKNELIKSLKRYLGFKVTDKNAYKKLVGWIKEYSDQTKIPAISKEQVEKVIKIINNSRDRALFYFLFDSGCRIEEALNLKIKDIEKHEKEDKKGFYYLVDIRISKTLPRRISIPLSSQFISKWLEEHPDRINPEAFLFPLEYDASRKIIKTASFKALGFKVTPHQLRHSSASYYCKLIDNPYKFCYRYGWKFGSREANRYIDRNLLGEEEQEKLLNIVESDRFAQLEKEVDRLKTENKGILGLLKKSDFINKTLLKKAINDQ